MNALIEFRRYLGLIFRPDPNVPNYSSAGLKLVASVAGETLPNASETKILAPKLLLSRFGVNDLRQRESSSACECECVQVRASASACECV